MTMTTFTAAQIRQRQSLINDVVVDQVEKSPGISHPALEKVCDDICIPRQLIFCGGKYFSQRVDRLVRQKLIVKLFVNNRNVYFPPSNIAKLAEVFNLLDSTDRKVAADYCEEMLGDDVLAAALRKATRICGL